MFGTLTERLNGIFRRLSGRGRLQPQDVETALREVRLALLEADVNFRVVKEFIERVRARAVGAEVLESLAPAHQVIKIVRDELAELLGGNQAAALRIDPPWPVPVVLVGLQGSGKTSSAAKLGLWLKGKGRRVLLVACDLRRPAAVEQLRVLGEAAGLEVFSAGQVMGAVEVARAALQHARRAGHEVVVFDTAGRLHVDAELMEEADQLVRAVAARHTLLVVDAMTGQDAVNVAQNFAQRLRLDGVILTKLDGDSRGGAALSVRSVAGVPILFAGTGEKIQALEPFYPDRMAGRILGMGDVLTLIEKAEQAVETQQAEEMLRRLRRTDQFGLDDFLEQLRQVRRMGPLEQILSMIPGLGGQQLKGIQVDERELVHVEAMIQSMTPQERRNPAILNGSRRRRVARGSGVSVQDVNRLLKQYEQARQLMRQFARRAPVRGAAADVDNTRKGADRQVWPFGSV